MCEKYQNIGMSGNLLNFGEERSSVDTKERMAKKRGDRGRGEIETVKNAGTCGTRHLLNCAISETPGRVILTARTRSPI